jgi:nucleoid-associated protein YgaU
MANPIEGAAEQFKQLPTGGKIAIVGVFVLVAGIGYYEYTKGKSSGIGASSPTTTLGGSTGVGSQLPTLPFGTTALTDANGNPVAFINPQTPTTPTPSPPIILMPHPPSPPPTPPVSNPTPPRPPSSASTRYTVRPGDTLWGIAAHYYGNGSRYTDIYNANKGTIGGNPNLILPGQALTIPKK